jgi:hypothetical protein
MEANFVILNREDIKRIENRVGKQPLVRLNYSTEFAKDNKTERFGIARNGEYFVVELLKFPKVVYYKVSDVEFKK